MRDDFGCINFAGGEVSHLVAFSKPTLSQNFPTAVALPRGRVSDDPGHLRGHTALIQLLSARLARPLRGFTHAAAVCLLGTGVFLYFHLRWLVVPHSECSPELVSEVL